MEKNSSFQRLVGCQGGQDPRSIKVQGLVPLLTCNKDISRHKSSLRLMTGSGVDMHWSEIDFSKVFNFQFPFQYFWHGYLSRSSFFAGHWVAKGFSALPYTSPAVEARPQIPYHGSWNQERHLQINLAYYWNISSSRLWWVSLDYIHRLWCYIIFHRSQVTWRAMLNTKIESSFNIYYCFIFFFKEYSECRITLENMSELTAKTQNLLPF